MICPKCQKTMVYKNQDYVSHGYYCTDLKCKGWLPCDEWCCTLEICPRCFGSGNWPWAQWGGPTRCVACDGAGKISGQTVSMLKREPEDRRNPKCPPRPGLIWSDKHKMWVNVDLRTPEEKAKHERIAADAEIRFQAAALRKPYNLMTPAERREWNRGANRLMQTLKKRRQDRNP